MSSVTDLLANNPELALAVALLARAVLAWQRELTWPEYRLAHRARRVAFPLLDGVTTRRFGRSLVNAKGGRDDPEFLATVDRSLRAVVSDCRAGGGSLHLLSTLKRRPDTHGDPLSIAHVVWSHADGTQVESYLFRNSNGSTDVYAHMETSVKDPVGHLTDKQTDGDPKGVVRNALEIEKESDI